jgi:hypothetical protein
MAGLRDFGGEATLGQQKGAGRPSHGQLWPAPGQARRAVAAAASPRQQAAQRPTRRRQQPTGDRVTE